MQVCTSLQTDNYACTPPLSFLQAGCPSCRPTNSVKALSNMKTINYTVQWRGERYDGTSTRTGPLQSKELKIELKDNAKNE